MQENFLQENLFEQCFPEDATLFFERIAGTVTDTTDDLPKQSKCSTEAIEDLDRILHGKNNASASIKSFSNSNIRIMKFLLLIH